MPKVTEKIGGEMGGHGFGMFISFFGAWQPRRNLGIRFELTIL
jgi:hypothetical protein